MSPLPDPDELLEEQVAYYRARAPEYDDWWKRTGPYDRGEAFRRAWDAEVGEVAAALDAFGPTGAVVELAAGTGNWTRHLARTASSVTAVDSSPETLAINRRKVAGSGVPVEHVVADVFAWEPPRRYDVVFFSFWLTHVPPGRFDAFWELVDRALAPGGRVFLVDNAVPRPDEVAGQAYLADMDRGVSRRQLSDGREYHVVKVFWSPDDLRRRLAPLGWEADLRTTASAFLYGPVRRVPG